ncbi:MAG: hypothetical protein KBS95_05400 [Alistipes sp.]|nr:hypothetical protein [Candidatus Alistipes equi]
MRTITLRFCSDKHELHYFNSKKQGELDFAIVQNGVVIPIEVKSGKNYERHNALSNVLNVSNYDIFEAYVLCNDNLSVKGNRIYLPIYMLMFIHSHPKPKKQIYTLDLTELK